MEENLSFNFNNVLGKENRAFYMGIAMIGIIGYHLYLHDVDFYNTSFKIFRNIFKYGYVGVDIFLFFSAYGLCHSWINSSAKNFYIKRFVRIVPIYLFFCLVKYCFDRDNNIVNFIYYRLLEISSLSLVQTKWTCPGNLSLNWFVPAIINLYLLFPLFFYLIKTVYKRSVIVHIIFIMCIFFGSHLFWNIGIIHGLYVSRIPIIFVGIFTYFYLKDKRYDELFFLYAIFAMMTYIIDRDNLRLSCVVPIILYALSFKNFTIVKGRNIIYGISLVGKTSFECFLAHSYALTFCPHNNVLYTILITLGLTLIITYILHKVNTFVSSYILMKIK